MILTRNWLAKFMNLDQISNDQITTALNSLGFEVDKTVDYQHLNQGLVIGYIEDSQPIEGTHLTVNQVKIGSDKVVQIVCGASNVEAKTFVIVAPIKASLANGLIMSTKEIHGYSSQGMICALNEIGIPATDLTSQENESIYVIHSYNDLSVLIGEGIEKIGFNDFSWEVDLTLNRSDALSAVQLLKELGNYFQRPINYYRLTNKVKNQKKKVDFSLKINPALTSQVQTAGFSLFEINNDEGWLDVDDDLWLKFNKVSRQTNYLYDLANKMTLEIGQPAILIDYDKLKNAELNLTTTKMNDQELIVLKNGARVVEVLGMGVEKNFLVDEKTKRMLVLYFNFNPVLMRGQQKNLNQSTIALQRYIKPLYANKFEDATEALKDIFDDYAAIKEVQKVEYLVGPLPVNNKFETSLTTINHLLGTSFDVNEIRALFKFIDFEITIRGDNLTFIVDPNRIDLHNAKDLAQEVARFKGYDQVPSEPLNLLAQAQRKDFALDLQTKMITNLVGQGLTNIKTYSLIESGVNKAWNLFNLAKPLKLPSPLSKLHEVYRVNLIQSLLEVAENNALRGNRNLKLFEVADLYYKGSERVAHLGILFSGEFNRDFREKRLTDFYDLKGLIENIFSLYQLEPTKISYEPLEGDKVFEGMHPYQNAKIKFNNKVLGFIFRLNPQTEAKLKLPPTFLAELDLDSLFKGADLQTTIQPWSKFQATKRDLSLEVSAKISYSEITNIILAGVLDVVDCRLVDVYVDDQLKTQELMAWTFQITFNNSLHQLNEQELNQAWNQVLSNVEQVGLKVR